MTNDRQPVLDDLQVDAATAIELAELNTLTHGTRPVNQRALKRILQVIGGYRSDDCYLTAEAIAKRIAMDERTVRAAIRALVADGLILEWGPRNRRHRAVHWTEIGRRIPRSETIQPRQTTAAAVSQPVARSGQSEDHCPDDPGNGAPIARMLPGNGSPIARFNRAVAARTYKEQENNLIISSSSKALSLQPPAGGDDDEEGSLEGCTTDPSGWTPESEAEVVTAIQAAGVYAWRESIDNAKSRDVEPDAVLEALFVAMNHRHPLTGDLLLGPAGFVTWTRGGSFPCDNPPTAAELRERIATKQQRQYDAERQRQRDAETIRDKTRAAAAAEVCAPTQRLVLAVTFDRLARQGLQDLATREEREANEQWQQYQAAQRSLQDHGTADGIANAAPARTFARGPRGSPATRPDRNG
jgi:hypothetical protein